MIDLQKRLDLQNLFYSATKEVKSYSNAKNPTKDQVKNMKEK